MLGKSTPFQAIYHCGALPKNEYFLKLNCRNGLCANVIQLRKPCHSHGCVAAVGICLQMGLRIATHLRCSQ